MILLTWGTRQTPPLALRRYILGGTISKLLSYINTQHIPYKDSQADAYISQKCELNAHFQLKYIIRSLLALTWTGLTLISGENEHFFFNLFVYSKCFVLNLTSTICNNQLRAIPFKNGEGGKKFCQFSRPPYTKKWHFRDPPIQQNAIFETPLYKKLAFLRPPYTKKITIFPPLPIFKWKSPKRGFSSDIAVSILLGHD